ncbi:hypothetical protein PROFUN_09668 [Planoprotostelium fungivorum]|uniref:IPT/TIG domain-containing protein n=1 Tax=Planoprotostelium fungivorum TaxID=1890364 RepID=A0A2P6NGL2_9EUKA|nr:hypothetical protein PROFUN_09668 [Planoprotostelium fungivorum]
MKGRHPYEGISENSVHRDVKVTTVVHLKAIFLARSHKRMILYLSLAENYEVAPSCVRYWLALLRQTRKRGETQLHIIGCSDHSATHESVWTPLLTTMNGDNASPFRIVLPSLLGPTDQRFLKNTKTRPQLTPLNGMEGSSLKRQRTEDGVDEIQRPRLMEPYFSLPADFVPPPSRMAGSLETAEQSGGQPPTGVYRSGSGGWVSNLQKIFTTTQSEEQFMESARKQPSTSTTNAAPQTEEFGKFATLRDSRLMSLTESEEAFLDPRVGNREVPSNNASNPATSQHMSPPNGRWQPNGRPDATDRNRLDALTLTPSEERFMNPTMESREDLGKFVANEGRQIPYPSKPVSMSMVPPREEPMAVRLPTVQVPVRPILFSRQNTREDVKPVMDVRPVIDVRAPMDVRPVIDVRAPMDVRPVDMRSVVDRKPMVDNRMDMDRIHNVLNMQRHMDMQRNSLGIPRNGMENPRNVPIELDNNVMEVHRGRMNVSPKRQIVEEPIIKMEDPSNYPGNFNYNAGQFELAEQPREMQRKCYPTEKRYLLPNPLWLKYTGEGRIEGTVTISLIDNHNRQIPETEAEVTEGAVKTLWAGSTKFSVRIFRETASNEKFRLQCAVRWRHDGTNLPYNTEYVVSDEFSVSTNNIRLQRDNHSTLQGVTPAYNFVGEETDIWIKGSNLCKKTVVRIGGFKAKVKEVHGTNLITVTAPRRVDLRQDSWVTISLSGRYHTDTELQFLYYTDRNRKKEVAKLLSKFTGIKQT